MGTARQLWQIGLPLYRTTSSELRTRRHVLRGVSQNHAVIQVVDHDIRSPQYQGSYDHDRSRMMYSNKVDTKMRQPRQDVPARHYARFDMPIMRLKYEEEGG